MYVRTPNRIAVGQQPNRRPSVGAVCSGTDAKQNAILFGATVGLSRVSVNPLPGTGSYNGSHYDDSVFFYSLSLFQASKKVCGPARHGLPCEEVSHRPQVLSNTTQPALSLCVARWRGVGAMRARISLELLARFLHDPS